MSIARHLRLVLPATALATCLAVSTLGTASAHERDDRQDAHLASAESKREQFTAGASVPLLSSPTVELVTNIPDTSAISGCFAKGAPYFYVSSLKSVSVYDVKDPLAPKLTGVLDNLVFENEAMHCGEKTVNGKKVRFVLVGVDLTQASSGDIEHVRPVGFDEFLIIDVTDPAKPFIRSRAKTTSSTHTIACIRATACDYVYTAGDGGENPHFSVVDVTNLDAPKEIAAVRSPALNNNPQFGGGAGHKWNFDSAGYGLHTGSGGTAIFDVRTPTNPKLVTSTGAAGTSVGWNDFIHHNSARPNGPHFKADSAPSLSNGNVLLVTEEDYENTDCTTAGSFQTWHVKKLDGTPNAITPLDRINPVQPGEGPTLPNLAFCSAHWFDYHQSGIIAQGFYQGGMRLLDVRDPKDIKEYGYFASGLSEVWDAYWVPQRNSNGVITGRKTNVVYTVDLIRGLDVLRISMPGTTPGEEPLPDLPIEPLSGASGSGPDGDAPALPLPLATTVATGAGSSSLVETVLAR